MRKIFFIFFFFILFCSCSSESLETPIPEETFVNILTDLYLVDGACQSRNVAAGDTLKQKLFNSVLSHYGFSQTDFDSTLTIYSQNLKEFNDVNEQVLFNIEQKIK